MKDVLNHIAARQVAAMRVAPELLQGHKASAGHGTKGFDALHYAGDKDRPLGASRRRPNRGRRELLAPIGTLPAPQIPDRSARIGWYINNTTLGYYGKLVYEQTAYR